jgi:ribose transport system substrate-binding protein
MRASIRVALLAVGALLAALALGCGSSDSSSTTGSSSSNAKPADDVVAQADKALEVDYAGTDRELPKSGPKAATGKTVWVLSCTQAGAGCALPAAGAVEAAKAIGWNVKLVDGKYDPATYNSLIRQATAAKVDGIVLVVVDCALVQGSLKAAKAAGIKIYGLYALDCDDKYAGGGTPQFDASIQYADGATYGTYIQDDYAKAIADYVIAKTDGKAKVIQFKMEDTAVVRHIGDGFEAEMKTCTGCKVYTKVFTAQEFLGNKLQGFTTSMLTQHPDANVVMAPYDASILLGIGPAVQQAKAQGRKLMLTGGEGLPPNIKLIKSGLQTSAAGAPSRWVGWASIDGLNRVFAGEPQVDAGIGHQTIDATHNVPTGPNGYDGNAKSAGYDANYKKIWGVGG